MANNEMSKAKLEAAYDKAAREYYRSLPPGYTIDPVSQGIAREITLQSFDLIQYLRPDIQCFNELPIDYPVKGSQRNGRVVPNNFVVIHSEPILAYANFDIEQQPTRPILVVEYVTEYRNPEHYECYFKQYEQELKVPYYLRIHPDDLRIFLFSLENGKYVTVRPDGAGRYAIPELELEVGLLDRQVRYWFRGKMMQTPGELYYEIKAAEANLTQFREELKTKDQS